jgi:disulfide bond formation protein DsbB
MIMPPRTAIALNALGLFGIAAILAIGFVMQFVRSELPCPLCLLQRAFFCAVAMGPILNLRFGPRPSHYALSILAALGGAAVSMRQVLLHILPGDPGYGSAVYGYHYYTWAFLLFVAMAVAAAVMLLFDRALGANDNAPVRMTGFARAAIWVVIALTAANVLSTLAICGFAACPDNPVRYELLQGR